jgi:hypothetical protein
MTVFQFDEWLPDQQALATQGMVRVENALPGPSGYVPARRLTASVQPLESRPYAAIETSDYSQVLYQFAATQDKLWRNTGGQFTDISNGVYTTSPTDGWEFVQWKDKVIATNYANLLQIATLGTGNFADLTGATTEGGDSLRAAHIAVIRDHIVVGNTYDTVDTEQPSRVRWSAFNDETKWAVDPTTLSGFQDLKVSRIVRIIGGEYGVVFQPGRIWRMTYVGAPQVFQFDEVIDNIGILAPGAVVRLGDSVYFWSYQGFYELIGGQRVRPIGANKVDNFAINDVDDGNLNRISCAADPRSQRIYWSYPGDGSVGGAPNRLLVYDVSRDRWSLVDDKVELLWVSGGLGLNIDADHDNVASDPNNLDDTGDAGDVPPYIADPPNDPNYQFEDGLSYDDPRWGGTTRALAGFDENYASGFFDGENLTAVFVTKEFSLFNGRRGLVTGFRPLVDRSSCNGGSCKASVFTRQSLVGDATKATTDLVPRAEGKVPCRVNARYHRIRLEVAGDWNFATGIQVDDEDLKPSHGRD